ARGGRGAQVSIRRACEPASRLHRRRMCARRNRPQVRSLQEVSQMVRGIKGSTDGYAALFSRLTCRETSIADNPTSLRPEIDRRCAFNDRDGKDRKNDSKRYIATSAPRAPRGLRSFYLIEKRAGDKNDFSVHF